MLQSWRLVRAVRALDHAVRSLYRPMATEHVHVPAPASDWTTPASDWPSVAAPEVARTPINEGLIEVATGMVPGKALDLGCGEGQNSVWLAQRGWVVNSVDMSPGAISEARSAADAAGVAVVFDVADISDWRPVSRYDLVFCTFALPARGMGRSRMLDMAVAAVAPGGTILVTEFDISLRKEGWMAEKYLVSTEELERHLDGFRVNRSAVRMARHRHGYEERILPVANVIATRRTDLHTSY
jgi:2-polyprenyl-3-methyl-5-hydroxy-6-metoxy-1,4-benzoquinol methylase